MYEKLLSSAGLSPNEAAIYEILLTENAQKAGKIALKSPLKRALVYKILDDLVAKGLAVRAEPAGKVAVFGPTHPDKLRELAQKRSEEAETARQNIESLIPQLASTFNLAAGKPGVRFFEGEEGIKKVWWDSLQSDEIYTYLDLESVTKNFAKLNDEYFRERQRRNVPKKAIANDSPANRKFLQDYDQKITSVRLIKNFPMDFAHVTMHIYNNKISYTTLDRATPIGVIIEDKLIYQMHKKLFEMNWQNLAENKNTTKDGGEYKMDLSDYKPLAATN